MLTILQQDDHRITLNPKVWDDVAADNVMAARISTSSTMSRAVPWSALPQALIEVVLSFLPVPMLCRLRTVCKGWNDLLCEPSFHELYEQNRTHHRGVCFLTRFKVTGGFSKLDPTVKGATCFLDFDERRWYSIKGSQGKGSDTLAVAMDEGLVAEFLCEDGGDLELDFTPTVSSVVMSDPISKMRWSLEPPIFERPGDDKLPLFVVATDRASRTFRIFLMDNSGVILFGLAKLLRIYESSTNKWRCASHPQNLKWEGGSHPPKRFSITRARSAVFFRGDLYAILSPFSCNECCLMKYDCEKDAWSMILQDLLDQPDHPELLVSSNRLLLMRFWRSNSSTSSARAKPNLVVEMAEIQTPENTSRTVFKISSASLNWHFFGTSIQDLTCVVPRFSSDGSCSSMALVASSTGRVVMYNVASGSAEILPAHPFRGATLKQSNSKPGRVRYWATHKNLNFRDILRKDARSHPPVYVPEHQLKSLQSVDGYLVR